jgi:outer membrane protein OmpA-like peptidoglycan-associated protein
VKLVARSVLVLAMVSAGSVAADRRAPIHVGYDADHLDLDKHVLQFKPSRPIAEASLVVIGEDGQELGKGSMTYDHPPAEAWWTIEWTQRTTDRNTRAMVLKLRVAASDGVATNVELVPWSVTIDHEDVTFRTDSAVIDEDQRAKLDATMSKLVEVVKVASPFMKPTLYIAGHTDTVGSAAKNRKLSLERATAIGQYFRTKKLAIPIVVAGFGEEVLKVKTADEADEAANRRADYVIGPSGAPPFHGPYAKVKADWKSLR